MEFHISRTARDRYQFDQSLFSIQGNVLFVNFHAARQFTQKMNQKLDLVNFPEQAVKASQINAMGLIDEILHYVISLYREQANPQVFEQAAGWLDRRLGQEHVDQVLLAFIDEFPPLAVYQHTIDGQAYLQGETNGVSNRVLTLEELLMLRLTTTNPAMQPFAELFDDTRLAKEPAYPKLIETLQTFFETQPFFGPDHQNLVEMLRSPAIAVPYSLSGQLEYIREHWAGLLGKYLYHLLSSLDLIKEENRINFQGPGPTPVPVYLGSALETEPERFSPDRDWMPTLVLLAKNAFVWLDQLSKQYQQRIDRLDLIPDDELDTLARRGFSGLWLIGVWERSQASAEIKQRMGNTDAVASAYSLCNYNIAQDLGGEAAYQNLRERAWKRGIRLASDMVPNHMGIDSEWVMNEPDRFIALDYSPYPSYTFNGPDLSKDPRVGVFIEDHYYTKSDAAVVFKRLDRWTGQEKYIYHGNDGTSMPWNDTAQLNYLNPEVREAVIQTILHVARMFPVIRFDAAMTLAKKHYERLWFPEPGTGGAIPSRAEHGMTHEQFNALMPVEFWREVVDRVAQEAPDTLLLAEAFWLMEGYFVRTLGMHRVYNSAFMNLLRNEENSKYRSVMKNTLEFDPEILKRYVNFMNNPDERTAAEQFGKGDKYFGICLLMATMPGLPMFGHGQVEGYTEKYGMEFRRAYWDEQPDETLVRRHERDIFPLLHRRYLFSGVENFLLYDFFTPEGTVNEDVFAYSNGAGNERALVVYHNKFGSTRGWMRTSAAYASKGSSGSGLVQKTLVEGLRLHGDDRHFTIFRDHITGLEYIRSSSSIAEQGFYVELNAYGAHVFLDIHEVEDDPWGEYSRLNVYLEGRGVPSIQEALRELFLQPIHRPFQNLLNPGLIQRLLEARRNPENLAAREALFTEVEQKYRDLIRGIQGITGVSGGDPDEILRKVKAELNLVVQAPTLEREFPLPTSKKFLAAIEYLKAGWQDEIATCTALVAWVIIHNLGRIGGAAGFEEQSLSWMDEWLLGRTIAETGQALGMSEPDAWQMVTLVRLLTAQDASLYGPQGRSTAQVLQTWLEDQDVSRYLGVNRFKDVLWFNQEAFERFLWWMFLIALIRFRSEPAFSGNLFVEQVILAYSLVQQMQKAEKQSEFQVSRLIDAV